MHAGRLVSYVTFLSVAFVIEYIPAKTNSITTITLAWENDSLVFVNVYTGIDWNKAIHNGLNLPLVLALTRVKTQKMADEVFPRITS